MASRASAQYELYAKALQLSLDALGTACGALRIDDDYIGSRGSDRRGLDLRVSRRRRMPAI